MQTLEERLARIREGSAKRIPAEDLALMHGATQALVESRLHEAALGEGDSGPDFELPDSEGEIVSLSSLLARGPAVIAFFRGHW